MPKIKIMDDSLKSKIKAGEVILRCVSVVKELIENSIDANSNDIMIELIESGMKNITVTDNGDGMDKEDSLSCFLPQASSKVIEYDDLYYLKTLGFRGEALASIASVSEIILETCNQDSSTTVHIKDNEILDVSAAPFKKGTRISVQNLFYNTPVRLKQITSLYAELATIINYVHKMSLSYPNISFTLKNDNNVLFSTRGDNNTLKVISTIYGVDIAKNMTYVEASNDDYKIKGYIGSPMHVKSNNNHITTFANNRLIKNSDINKNINEAYGSLKMDNRYPIVVLFIDTDPFLIDINIHPTKMDIKFSKQKELEKLIYDTIYNEFHHKNNTVVYKSKISDNDKIIPLNVTYESIEYDKSSIINEPTIKEEKTYNMESLDFDTAIMNVSNEKIVENGFKAEEKKKFPVIYPASIIKGTYIVCSNDEGMYLIDSHAAKERIDYEKIIASINDTFKDKISMLYPLTLEYTADEFLILKNNLDVIRNLGFDIDEFGINTFSVKAHPRFIDRDLNETIKKIFDIVISVKNDFDMKKFVDKVSATIACKNAIKANTYLNIEDMQALINDLSKCDNPFNCPHGRPLIINFTYYELERMFKRIV